MRPFLTLAAAIIVAGCTATFPLPADTASASPVGSPLPSPAAVSSREDASSLCAKGVLRDFIDAFNAGDPRVDGFFQAQPGPRDFQWFFVLGLTPPYGPPLRELPLSSANDTQRASGGSSCG